MNNFDIGLSQITDQNVNFFLFGLLAKPASTKVSSNASTELPICHLKQAKKNKKQDDERKKQKTHAKKKPTKQISRVNNRGH